MAGRRESLRPLGVNVLRRLSVCGIALWVTLVAAAPAGAAPLADGTATTDLVLAELDLAGLPVGSLGSLSLGTLTSFASTDADIARNAAGAPFAEAALDLPVVGRVGVSSAGQAVEEGRTLALPAGAGDLVVGRMDASASEERAAALLQALTGTVSASVAGLTATVPPAGVSTVVDADAARATNGAALEGLALHVGDLLPVDLLAQLPLSTLLDLVDGLGLDLDLPVDPAQLLQTVRDLVESLEAVEALQGGIDDAQATLDDLAGGLPSAQGAVAELDAAVSALRAQLQQGATDLSAPREQVAASLDALQTDVAALEGAAGGACAAAPLCQGLDAVQDSVASLDSQVTAVDGAISAAEDAIDAGATASAVAAQLDQALANLAAAQDVVDQLNALIDQAQVLVDDLLAQLDATLDQLQGVLAGLGDLDLAALVRQLVDGLAAGELLAVDAIRVGVATTATADDSTASATCAVQGVRVLGQPQQVASCTDLRDALADVTAAVTDLLAGLPLAGALPTGAVTLKGLATTTSMTREGAYSVATAAVTALELRVAPLDLARTTDALVVEVTALVNGALADVGELTGIDASSVATITDQLEGLLSQLRALPTGALLGSLATPEVGVRALGAKASSSFTRAAEQPAVVTPAVPEVAAGTVPAPQVTPGTNLPRTGSSLLVPLALLALGAGGAVAARRRGA